MPRPIYEIANDVRKNWPKVPEQAEAYLGPMASLTNITDTYGADDARYVLTYFLGNATGWRGAEARRIKAEIKELLK